MKRAFSLALCLCLCAALLCAPALSRAENNVEQMEEWLTGLWKATWRFLPAVTLTNTSDAVKPVNLFRFPGEFAKAGMTVTSSLVGDDTGDVYLVLSTAGSSHGIVSFDGGYVGRVYLSSDHNTMLVAGVDGSAIVYQREEEE